MVKKQKKKPTRRLAPRAGAVSPASTPTDDFFHNGMPSSGFNNLPTGVYDGYIKPGSFIIEPKPKGGHKASCTLVVPAEEGGQEDRTQAMRCDLSTQTGVDIFLGELKILGFDQAKCLKEASEMLPETDNVPVRFWVGVPKDENPPNVRFNERLEGAGSLESPAEPTPEASSGDYYTREEILAMDETDICTFNKDEELKLDPDKYGTWEEFNEACAVEYGV